MFSLNEVIIITTIFSVIVGYLSAKLAEFRIITRMLNELSDEELAKLTKEIEEISIISDVISDGDKTQSYSKTLIQEVVAGQIFLYDEHDNFVAQGNSASEAAQVFFTSRHSASVAIVQCGEGNSYKIINGKIET